MPRASAAVLLAFLASFGAVATQYLLWPLPWLLMSNLPLRWSVLYALGTTAGALGFYLVYWPQLILGPTARGGPAFAAHYVAGEVVAWLTIVVVYAAAIGRPSAAGQGWKALSSAALVAVAVSAYPAVRLIAWLAGEWLRFRG